MITETKGVEYDNKIVVVRYDDDPYIDIYDRYSYRTDPAEDWKPINDSTSCEKMIHAFLEHFLTNKKKRNMSDHELINRLANVITGN